MKRNLWVSLGYSKTDFVSFVKLPNLTANYYKNRFYLVVMTVLSQTEKKALSLYVWRITSFHVTMSGPFSLFLQAYDMIVFNEYFSNTR